MLRTAWAAWLRCVALVWLLGAGLGGCSRCGGRRGDGLLVLRVPLLFGSAWAVCAPPMGSSCWLASGGSV
eukprot:1118116-Prorocentrum_lima.AAC.1